MKDDLGNRIKSQYENRTKYFLPRRSHFILRLDGKAFHSLTRKCERPFDPILMYIMDETAKYLCSEIQGAKFGFVQSDEISILFTDFDKISTSAFFDLNIQKICSVSASMAAAKFNDLIRAYPEKFNNKLACFDSRVFCVPDPYEVANVFVWRQVDMTRNSIQMVAQANFSHKELQGKNCNELQEMLFSLKGINWNNYKVGEKRGRFIERVLYDHNGTQRSRWDVVEPPIFTQDPNFLMSRIPRIEDCIKNEK